MASTIFSSTARVQRLGRTARVAYQHHLLLICLITLLVSGCAGTSRVAGSAGYEGSSGPTRHGSATPEQEEESWLEAGANSLAAARDKLRSALHGVYESWAGTPYRYGGESRHGVDCSSFVQQTMDQVESFELPRTTVEQARIGLSVPKTDLRAGDLVFFKTGRLSRHVGIYLGQGRFMHASSSVGVTISRLDNVYWRHHYWQSRRVIANRGPVGRDPSSL